MFRNLELNQSLRRWCEPVQRVLNPDHQIKGLLRTFRGSHNQAYMAILADGVMVLKETVCRNIQE